MTEFLDRLQTLPELQRGNYIISIAQQGSFRDQRQLAKFLPQTIEYVTNDNWKLATILLLLINSDQKVREDTIENIPAVKIATPSTPWTTLVEEILKHRDPVLNQKAWDNVNHLFALVPENNHRFLVARLDRFAPGNAAQEKLAQLLETGGSEKYLKPGLANRGPNF